MADGSGSGSAEMGELLAQLDRLRLSASADLGVAASAVEADELGVACDVLAGTRGDLAGFSSRAGGLLP